MRKIFGVMLVVLFTMSMLMGCSEKVYGKEKTNIEAKSGARFKIKLEENPTTGYAWTVKVSDESVVKLSDDQYTTETEDEDIAGAGGVHTYTFEALAEGSTQITFTYERSFEENSAVETIVYNVTVK